MSETTQTACGFPGDRDETLIAYLYGDIDPATRAAFDAHLPACARCRDELTALGAVRTQLSTWSPPSFAVAGQSVLAPSPQPLASKWWQEVPAWAQVAAALVFLGVGAGLANLDVHYDRTGLSVRTGWSRSVPVGVARDFSPASANSANPAPWRADMTALEQQLRTQFRASATNGAEPVRNPRFSRLRACPRASRRRSAGRGTGPHRTPPARARRQRATFPPRAARGR